MKIRQELAKTNRELLEVATSFSFGEYRIMRDGNSWYVKKYNGVYNKQFETMEQFSMCLPLRDEHYFDNVYEAYEVVKELIK